MTHEENLEDLGFETLIKPPEIWIAEGNTFSQRREIQSWGFFWDSELRAWKAENPDPYCLMRVRGLPGVGVRKIND